MIIAFVQTKGGTGKSTLALNIAYSRFMRKEFPSIALVELDPQATLRKWWNRRALNGHQQGNIIFKHISNESKDEILEEIEMLENDNELLILDVPGESIGKFHTKFACAVADLVLIPMRTSTNDEEAFEDNLLPIIKKMIEIDQESRDVFYIIPSFTHPLANKKNVLSYFQEMMPTFIHCLPAVFSFGSVFENFSRGGNNLIEYGESVKSNTKLYEQAKKAIKEVEVIAQEIIQISSN